MAAFQFSFRSVGSYAAGQSRLIFRLGYEPQTIDIGGVELVNYGQRFKPEQFFNYSALQDPDVLPYKGAEPNAPLRADAAARIEQIRKGDMTVRVTDGNGMPIPGAEVEVAMQRHAFSFGSAVNVTFLNADATKNGADAAIYRQKVAELFNTAVIENEMKGQFESDAVKQAQVDKELQWLNSLGIRVRGHNLIWQEWKWSPPSFEQAKNNPALLKSTVSAYVYNKASRFQGRVTEWDVLNEPLHHTVMDGIAGPDEKYEWIKQAKQGDPGAEMYVNEYFVLERPTSTNDWDAQIEQLRQMLLTAQSKGAALDGVGLQSHFNEVLTSPVKLLDILDRLGAVVPHVKATEMDMDFTDEQMQGQYMRDFMTALFSHPSVNGILTWGFWDGMHWKNNAPFFRQDWSLKPAGQAYKDLVFGDWWTNVTGATYGDGRFATRGFLGDYVVTVRYGGAEKAVPLTLGHEGATVTVKLESVVLPANAAAPGKPVLSHNNGYDTGLRDGSYDVAMNMWYGNNGTMYRLYENDALIDTRTLGNLTPQPQSVITHVYGRGNGTYRYVAELSNAAGTAVSEPLVVTVANAAPAKPVLSHNNWSGSDSFDIEMNMWWGTNGSRYRLYENGSLIDERPLSAHSPGSQHAATPMRGKAPGVYEYRAELSNAAGRSVSEPIVVTVNGG